MSVETDTLAEAAQRFADAIKTERTTTLDALAAERKAATQIIEALRYEAAKRAQASSGRFVIGFLIGVGIGAVAVTMLTPRSGDETRMGLTANLGSARQSLGERLRSAVEAGKRAATSREQELWGEYRKRITDGAKPRDEDDSFRY
jgi:gas vesicle protein